MDLNINFTLDVNNRLGGLLSRLIHSVDTLARSVRMGAILMSQELDDLTTEVRGLGTVADSAVALLEGLADQIEAGAGDRAAMTALAAETRAKATVIAAAVQANTPAIVVGEAEPVVEAPPSPPLT